MSVKKTSDSDKSLYELIYIAKPELVDSAIEEYNKKITDVITNVGGKVSKVENWGVRSLAYKVNKYKKGIYCLLHIEAEPKFQDDIKYMFKVDDNLLRFLLIKVDELDAEPSKIMSYNKSEYERS